jgi:hypothetical protein
LSKLKTAGLQLVSKAYDNRMNEGMERRDDAGVEALRQKIEAEQTLLLQIQDLHRKDLEGLGTLNRAMLQSPVPIDRLQFDQSAVGVVHESIGERQMCERLAIFVPQRNPELPPCIISVLTLSDERIVLFEGFCRDDATVMLQTREELLSARDDEGLLPHLDSSLSYIPDDFV